MSGMTEGEAVRRINSQVPDTLQHYLAQEQQAQFQTAAIALLESAKVHVSRCSSIGAQQLSRAITDFLAQNRRKQP